MAYFNTFSMQMSNASDALFRAWTKAIHDNLIAVGGGWSVASDTGQMDFTTVLAPTGASQIRGYRVYVLTGSPSFYIILEYGSQGTGNTPSCWITVCTATNGAGVVAGGAKQTTRQTFGNSANEAAARTCLVFNYASGVGFALNYDGINQFSAHNFVVERIKDATGADSTGASSPQGIAIYMTGANNGNRLHMYQAIDYNFGVGNIQSTNSASPNPFGLSCPISGGTLFANKASLFPIRVFLGEELPPNTIFQGHLLADAGNGTTITVTMYGVTMTFYCFGTSHISGAINLASQAQYLAFRTS